MRLRISDKGTPRLYLNMWLTNKETLVNRQRLTKLANALVERHEKHAAMTKYARMALIKYLMKLPKAARIAKIKTLPPALREVASYKLLGNEAATATRAALGADIAHGYPHVFNVTRNAQQLAKGAPRAVRQRTVLGALSHDVGRGVETTSAARELGRHGKDIPQVLRNRPDLMHSELGGRWMGNFLNRNRQLTKNIPGLNRAGQTELKSAIRAHDTDAWSAIPYLRRAPGKAQWIQNSPTGRNVYLADKMDAFGRTGFNRTVNMSTHYKQTPKQVMDFVNNKNIPKYQNVIDTFAPSKLKPQLQGQLDEYGKLFKGWGGHQQAGPGFNVPMGPMTQPYHQRAFDLVSGAATKLGSLEKRAALWDKLLRTGKLGRGSFARILEQSAKGLGKFHNVPAPAGSDVDDMYRVLRDLGVGRAKDPSNSLISMIRSGLVPRDPTTNLKQLSSYLDKAI